jgi:hypothetical protein
VKPRRPEWLAAWFEWERKRSCHLPCTDIVRNEWLQCYFANSSIRPLPRGSDLPIDLRSPISVIGVLNEPLGDPMMSNVAPMLRWGLAARLIALERCLFWMAMPVCLQVVPCALNKSSFRLAGSTAIVSIPWRCGPANFGRCGPGCRQSRRGSPHLSRARYCRDGSRSARGANRTWSSTVYNLTFIHPRTIDVSQSSHANRTI